MRTQTVEVTMLDVPEGYDFIDLRIPEDGEKVYSNGQVTTMHGDASRIYPILKKIHKAPELVYCLQSSNCEWAFIDPITRKSVKGLIRRAEYCKEGVPYDLLEDIDGSIWLGHWNSGLEDEG